MTCLNEILGKGTTWMRACGITSHFLFRMAKEQSASARPRGARSLLLSLHPLRVCHFCVKVHSLLSKFEPCKSENRVSQPLAPLRGSQTVRHSPYEIKNERLFLDASIRNRLSFFISHGSKLIHTPPSPAAWMKSESHPR